MQGERKMLTRGEVGRGDLPQPSEGGEPQAAKRKPMTFVVVDV